MSDDRTPMYDDMDDLELITSYLNGHLPPDRAEAVRKRLEEDAEFREFAAPMLLIWSIPPRHKRVPRPEGEAERAWEEFVKRTGFPKRPLQEPKRRRWVFKLLQLLILAAAVAVYVWLEPIQAYVESRQYDPPLPYDTAWVTIGDGVQVRLTPGTSLRRKPVAFGRQWVLLDGTARFLVQARDSADRAVPPGRFRVRTRVGYVTVSEAEFTMTTLPDTTLVTVHPFGGVRSHPTELTWVDITSKTGPTTASTVLREGERGRIVRDSVPEVIRQAP